MSKGLRSAVNPALVLRTVEWKTAHSRQLDLALEIASRIRSTLPVIVLQSEREMR